MADKPTLGGVGWVDLTIPNAEEVKAFYSSVVGWKAEALDMGGYSDYVMSSPDEGVPTAGVCHARGSNAGLPAVWMVYFIVDNLDEAIGKVTASGGKIITGPKGAGAYGRFCVIEDPAGAVCALHEPASQSPDK